jgi:hypothetical protein
MWAPFAPPTKGIPVCSAPSSPQNEHGIPSIGCPVDGSKYSVAGRAGSSCGVTPVPALSGGHIARLAGRVKVTRVRDRINAGRTPGLDGPGRFGRCGVRGNGARQQSRRSSARTSALFALSCLDHHQAPHPGIEQAVKKPRWRRSGRRPIRRDGLWWARIEIMGGGSRTSDWMSYDSVAQLYQRVAVPLFSPIATDLIAAVRLTSGETLLDLGTGTGLVSR